MSEIERLYKIDKLKLSGRNYFETLIEQACLCGILSEEDVEKIKFDCLSLLAGQTKKYTSGESSSIRAEEAQDLLESIIFTMGVYLKTYISPDDAAADIKKTKLSELFEKGKAEIKKMTQTAKLIHTRISDNLLETPNVFYKATIIDGINGFFRLYYPEFGAQKIHITADYPTFNGVSDLTGIEFIKRYLENIYYENLFCKNFSEEKIHHLLCGVNENYEEMVINIYEPVFTSAIGCVVLGKNPYELELSASDLYALEEIFENKDLAQIEQILSGTSKKLKEYFSIREGLYRYLSVSISKIAVNIKNAEYTKALKNVFIIPAYPENNPVIKFSYGEKMDNKIYRKIIEEIMQCDTLKDKMQIIKESVRSLVDLEDVLLDGGLSDKEVMDILKMLTPQEFAALIKKYPYQSYLEMYDLKENEKQLCLCLYKYFNSLPEKQQNMLKTVVKFLKEGDS